MECSFILKLITVYQSFIRFLNVYIFYYMQKMLKSCLIWNIAMVILFCKFEDRFLNFFKFMPPKYLS